jgi:aspartate/methionine/tyrosine aminotransferase
VTSPEGALQLSVAENQLSEVPLKNVKLVGYTAADNNGELTLMDVLSALASSTESKPSSREEGASTMEKKRVFDSEMIYYQPTQGTAGLRKIMKQYLQNLLLPSSTTKEFDVDKLILGAGCNAVLENLCMTLCDEGDAVMIPTPYYAAFEFDLGSRAGCNVVPVNTMEYHPSHKDGGVIEAESYYPNKASLDAAYECSIRETGRPPRVLLLSHPNNPLGVCYPPTVMKECIDWCREREVHLISDEIYAGSVYRKTTSTGDDEATFVSAMELASEYESSDGGLGLGPYVHLVYALSKDFALSGLRVGVAYTENEEILFALQKLNDFCQISSHTQLLVERMLSAEVERDNGATEKFVDAYLDANNRNIQSRADQLATCLDELEIPYLKPDSGLFLWMDFREFLPELSTSESATSESLESKERRERELYLSLMKEYGLLFTPGMSMRNEHAGFFRCVFTAASKEEFELGLARIKKFVQARRSVD